MFNRNQGNIDSKLVQGLKIIYVITLYLNICILIKKTFTSRKFI